MIAGFDEAGIGTALYADAVFISKERGDEEPDATDLFGQILDFVRYTM